MAVVNKDTVEVVRELFDTSTEHDEKAPWINDVSIMEVEGFQIAVLSDFNNKCLKSFYTRSKECQSRLQLNDIPWCISQLGDNELMSSLPYIYQIVTVALTPDLVYVSHINTSKMYFGLAVMSSSRLAAGCSDSVDILDMQGEVLQSVNTDASWTEGSRPWYLSVNHIGHLLVSDWGEDSVTCMKPSGHTVWVYSGTRGHYLRHPQGITTTREGDILVADSTLKKVIKLSKSGEYVGDVLTSVNGLNLPKGLYLDVEDSLFICDSGDLFRFVFLIKK